MPDQSNLKANPSHRSAVAPGRTQRKRKTAAPPASTSTAAPPARHPRRQCPTESCSRCGLALGSGEPAYLMQGRTVCGGCHATRQASLVAAALAAPRMPLPDETPACPRPWWRRALGGTRDLVCLPLTVVGKFSRKNRRRRQQAAVVPLLDHLYRVAHRA